MNHFVHQANSKAIYFEHPESFTCDSSVIVLPPYLSGCSCDNLRACAPTQTSYNGYYPVLRSDSNRWHLHDPCDIPLMFDSVHSNVFQNRSLLRNEKVIKSTKILDNLKGCFNSKIHFIGQISLNSNAKDDCTGHCYKVKSCVAYSFVNSTCLLFNSIPQTIPCDGSSGVISDRYKCEKLR